MSSDRQNSLNVLHPFVEKEARNALANCISDGLNCYAFETLRTVERQNNLYLIGRDLKGQLIAPIVTKSKGGLSWHQYGLAIDVVFKDSKDNWTWSNHEDKIIKDEYKKVAQIFKRRGFNWLGNNSKFPELPHFEMTFNLNIHNVKIAFELGGMKAVHSLIKTNKDVA